MRIKEGFVLREVAGEIIVIATGEASKDFKGMIRLNQTGKEIWEGLMNGLNEEEIAQNLAKNYEVDLEKAVADTHKYLKRMEEAGFLVP